MISLHLTKSLVTSHDRTLQTLHFKRIYGLQRAINKRTLIDKSASAVDQLLN